MMSYVEMRIYYKSSRAWGETTAIDTEKNGVWVNTLKVDLVDKMGSDLSVVNA